MTEFIPLKPLFEAWINYDSYREQDIVGDFEQGVDLQFIDPYNQSWLAQQLHNAGLVHAKKADFAIRGTTGYMGQYTISFMKVLQGQMSTTNFLAQLSGMVYTTPAYNTKDYTWLRENAEKLGEKGDADLKALDEMAKRYWNEPDQNTEIKYELAQRIWVRAERIRQKWEASGKIERTTKKKLRDKDREAVKREAKQEARK